jgi:hypothetical protein
MTELTTLLDNSLLNLMIRFFLNILVLYILMVQIYYRFTKKEEYLFSNIIIGMMIFLICGILGAIDLKLGLALGLFGIFAIIRFRTVTYTVRDITYVFLIIGTSIVNSQANIPPPVVGALVINTGIILLTYVLEKFLQKKELEKRRLVYRKLELLKPEFHFDLLRDLSNLTGQNVEKVIVDKVDYDRNRADIEIHYKNRLPSTYGTVPEKSGKKQFPESEKVVKDSKSKKSISSTKI